MSTPQETIVVAGAWGDTGKGIIQHLAKQGYQIVALGRTGKVTPEIQKYYDLDLSKLSDLEHIADEIFSNFKNVKMVVNAAGSYVKTNDDGFDESIHANNFKVAENILKVFTPKFSKVPGSRIVTVGSIDGTYPNINSFAYSISKASIKTMVDLYKKKYRDTMVNFDIILPGGMNTRMRAGKNENKEALIQPSDIAKLCGFLATLGTNVTFGDLIIYPKTYAYSN